MEKAKHSHLTGSLYLNFVGFFSTLLFLLKQLGYPKTWWSGKHDIQRKDLFMITE